MAKIKEKVEETIDIDTTASGIQVADPESFRPKVLPLIITFPEGYNPSKAQIERAKVLNGYAYSYPEKWKNRKDELLKELEALKTAPDPVEDPNVKLFVGKPTPTE